MTRIAFVGCGFVADLYVATLRNHSELDLIGVYDRDSIRQRAFTQHHGVVAYDSLINLLADERVEVVVNLTNPSSHFEVNHAALAAKKHVFVEKPLALDLQQAQQLVDLATANGLALGSAPSSLLGEAAQTAWRAVRRGVIGVPRLVYAELDDGPILRMPFHTWISTSGARWPYEDEFRTGCTIEHAGYVLTWLTAMFGPVDTLAAFAAPILPNPVLKSHVGEVAPDFSVACLRFGGGEVARLTTGTVAPRDRSLRIVGDEGVLTVADVWDFGSSITVARGRTARPEAYPLVRPANYPYNGKYSKMDFARGVADLARHAKGSAVSHLPVDQSLHVLELTLATATAAGGTVLRPKTTCSAVQPLPWAL